METDNNFVSELTSAPILIGKWTFYPDILQLECGDKNIKLEPRTASLLLHLTQNAGNPVSRNGLMEKTWPGMVVGDEALTSAITKLRKAFGDDTHHPEVIETIPKVGYRLIAGVKFLTVENAISDTNSSLKNRKITIISATISLAILVSLFFWFQRPELDGQPISPLPNKPSIAVLPFINLSGDSEQEYFSEGISEDIITDLSKLKSITVIARNSSFSYKGTSTKVQDIGINLGVKYLVEGSVRKAGNQIRITVQLVDTSNGHHLWAERFDRELTNIFTMQDEITGKIVSALSIQLTGDEQQQLAHSATSSFEAYDLFLQGQRFRTLSEEDLAQAAEIYRKVISLDPDFARAYGALSVVLNRQVTIGVSEAPAEMKERALDLARKAVSINPNSPQVLWALGYIYMYRGQFEEAVEALERAISLSPSYADGYALLGLIENNLGHGEDAIRLIEKGMKVNPHYSWDYLYNLGRARYALGHYQQASENLQEALERNETGSHPRLFLIASYVQLGQQDDAEWEAVQLDVSHPEVTLSHLRQTLPIADPELMERLISDLRSAGIAE